MVCTQRLPLQWEFPHTRVHVVQPLPLWSSHTASWCLCLGQTWGQVHTKHMQHASAQLACSWLNWYLTWTHTLQWMHVCVAHFILSNCVLTWLVGIWSGLCVAISQSECPKNEFILTCNSVLMETSHYIVDTSIIDSITCMDHVVFPIWCFLLHLLLIVQFPDSRRHLWYMQFQLQLFITLHANS